ncbi:MAG: PAS domain-containing protein [Magnetococcales bacterium]|nr:PAS domain-containing protein [Magnetococcales bacterium]
MGSITKDCFAKDHLWDVVECSLIVVDTNGIVRNLNLAAERLFGKSDRYIIGEELEKLLPGYPVALDLIQRAYDLKMPCRLRDAQISPAPGVVVAVSLMASPLRNENGDMAGALLQLEDLEAVEGLEDDQRLNDTLDSLGNMAMAVAHEVKNPLAGIRGAAQLLEMEIKSKSAIACTELIRTEVDRISLLLDKLLGLADEQLINKKELNIHEILDHVIQVCSHGSIIPVRDFDPSLPNINGDRDQLIQLFLNLVQNAIEANSNGGEVIISTRMSSRIRSERGQRRHFIVVEVKDNGPGILPALMQKIFLPFITSKHQGTGLGLAISQKIINEHEGMIEVKSKPGETVFRTYLHVFNS